MKKNLKKKLKKAKLNRNLGFNLEKEKLDRKPDLYRFGASPQKCLAEIPEGDRDVFLPVGELQFGREDFMDCASRSPLNLLEAKFNWLIRNNKLSEELTEWLHDEGYLTSQGVEFSDRFIAVLSGTSRSGNSLVAPIHAIHKYGLIPKKTLPRRSDMNWEEYHTGVTEEMKKLGQDFLARFSVGYEEVQEPQFEELLKRDMLACAGYAWPQPVNGEYGRVDYTPNHAFLVYKNLYFAFDNYLVSESFVKKLTKDYDFLGYGYRLFISLNTKKKGLTWRDLICRFFGKKV